MHGDSRSGTWHLSIIVVPGPVAVLTIGMNVFLFNIEHP
jgi:hypothetical protein